MPTTLPAVLVIAPHWPPDQGAAAARLAGLARELVALGHEVRAVAPVAGYMVAGGRADGTDDAAGREGDDALPVTRVAVRPRTGGLVAHALHQVRSAAALRAAARAALATFPADVVLASSPPPVTALAGLGLADRRGRVLPCVLDVRDLWPDVLVDAGALSWSSPAAAVMRLVETRLLTRAAAVIAVTPTKVARLRSRGAIGPVALVTNGVDPEWLDGPLAEGPPADAPFEVLCAGNVGLAQDVGLLVRAVARLGREPRPSGAPEVTATVVGAGERLAQVKALAAGLEAPVRFLAVETRAAIRARLRRCGCAFVSLASAALVDAVPSKLLEALAAGAPVVLAAAGESADLLRSSGGGTVVRPGDDEGLAAALRDLAGRSQAERRALGQAGRAFVARAHRREHAARALSEVLSRAAAPS